MPRDITPFNKTEKLLHRGTEKLIKTKEGRMF